MAADPKTRASSVPAASLSEQADVLLRRVSEQDEPVFIEENGQAKAVLMSFQAYWRLRAPAPEFLKRAWKAAEGAGLDKMTMEEIDAEIAATRRERQARKEEGAA